MNYPDLINGMFEFFGGFMLLLNCKALYRDKMVRGVNIGVTVFFTSWGYWNLYYYPHLNQWLSFAGGCFIVVSNTLWIAMSFYYLRKPLKSLITESH